LASTQNPQERHLKTAQPHTLPLPPPVSVKLTKPQVKPSAVMSQPSATPNARHIAGVRERVSAQPVQQNPGHANPATDTASQDALKLRRLQEAQAMHAAPIYKRALSLTSDAIILTLASPFLVVWWLVRTLKRLTVSK
jgi:hypothetical protein